MATDTSFGKVRKFEDFLITAIADLSEMVIATVAATGTTEVVSGADGGWLGLGVDTTDDDDESAVSFGAVTWIAGNTSMRMEARCLVTTSIADNHYFVGFSDSIASANDTTFSATTDTVTIDDIADGIGFIWDEDATTKNFWCVAGKTDSVTVGKVLSSVYNPVIDVPFTLGVSLSTDLKSATWSINGKEVYRLDSKTTLIAAVGLVPIVTNHEQAVAYTLEVDYLFGTKGRDED